MSFAKHLIFPAAIALTLLSSGVASAQSIADFLKNRLGDALREAAEDSRESVHETVQTNDLSRAERREAQAALNALGFDVGEPDGAFGRMTRQGIARFQERYGFTVTGQLDRAQFERLVAAAEVAGGRPDANGTDADTADSTVAADGSPPSTYSATLAELGVTTRNEEVMLGSTAIGFDGDGSYRLQLLLILTVEPEALEERHNTENFARILPLSVLERYMTVYGGGRSLRWKGESEFEQEDARLRFLAEQRDNILAMRPTLPMTVADIRSFHPRQYNFDRKSLDIEISSYLPWGSPGFVGFEADVPAMLPTRLELPANEARQLVEGTHPAIERLNPDDRRLSAALRYVITGVRKLDGRAGGAALDIKVLDLKLYGDRQLSEEIMDLPLGEGTIFAEPPSAVSEPSGPITPRFDQMTARLIAARLDPSLLDDQAFVEASFAIRRADELNYLKSGGTPPAFRRVMPPVLLTDSKIRPQGDDFETFVHWMREVIAQLGDELTFERNLVWSHSNNRLSAIAGGSGATPSSENQDLLRSMWPNSLTFGYLRSGRDLDVLYALQPSPYWDDESILAGLGDGDEAYVTVRVVETRLLPRGDVHMVALGLVPELVTIGRGADARVVALPEPEVPSIASRSDGTDPVSRFAVLGVTLGMPIAEAKALVDAAYVGKAMTPLQVTGASSINSKCGLMEQRRGRDIRALGYDIEYQQRLAEQDKDEPEALATATAAIAALEARLATARQELADALAEEGCLSPAASPLQFAFAYDIVHSKTLTERIAVYQRGELLGEPVVSAIYRQFTPDVIGERFMAGLIESYGDDYVPMDDGSDQVTWPDDPEQSARFGRNGDERCISFWRGDDSFPGQHLHEDCGAYLRAEKWRMVLIDSRFTARVLTQQMQAKAEQTREPEIKF